MVVSTSRNLEAKNVRVSYLLRWDRFMAANDTHCTLVKSISLAGPATVDGWRLGEGVGVGVRVGVGRAGRHEASVQSGGDGGISHPNYTHKRHIYCAA